MEILALNVAVILLHALTVVAIPAMVTPIKRDLPYYTGNDTASESFIGYTYDGECETSLILTTEASNFLPQG